MEINNIIEKQTGNDQVIEDNKVKENNTEIENINSDHTDIESEENDLNIQEIYTLQNTMYDLIKKVIIDRSEEDGIEIDYNDIDKEILQNNIEKHQDELIKPEDISVKNLVVDTNNPQISDSDNDQLVNEQVNYVKNKLNLLKNIGRSTMVNETANTKQKQIQDIITKVLKEQKDKSKESVKIDPKKIPVQSKQEKVSFEKDPILHTEDGETFASQKAKETQDKLKKLPEAKRLEMIRENQKLIFHIVNPTIQEQMTAFNSAEGFELMEQYEKFGKTKVDQEVKKIIITKFSNKNPTDSKKLTIDESQTNQVVEKKNKKIVKESVNIVDIPKNLIVGKTLNEIKSLDIDWENNYPIFDTNGVIVDVLSIDENSIWSTEIETSNDYAFESTIKSPIKEISKTIIKEDVNKQVIEKSESPIQEDQIQQVQDKFTQELINKIDMKVIEDKIIQELQSEMQERINTVIQSEKTNDLTNTADKIQGELDKPEEEIPQESDNEETSKEEEKSDKEIVEKVIDEDKSEEDKTDTTDLDFSLDEDDEDDEDQDSKEDKEDKKIKEQEEFDFTDLKLLLDESFMKIFDIKYKGDTVTPDIKTKPINKNLSGLIGKTIDTVMPDGKGYEKQKNIEKQINDLTIK